MKALLLALALLFVSHAAEAKDYGIRTPGGRHIYDDDEEFANVTNTRLRRFVVEAVVGAGPEGNIGALIGWLNQPVRGIEIYAGFGLEANPARHYTAAVRYVFNIHGYRPYVSLGYLFNDLYVLRTYSHNVFFETGYSWVLHDTYRLTAGLGLRYIPKVNIREDSPLRADDVDPVLLREQQDSVFPIVPTFALRFSRAF